MIYELVHNDRVIGGLNPESTDKAIEFYSQFVQGTLHKTNCRTAEMCKLTENSSRDVQIAFANELSLICDKAGINVWELIELANKHPRVNILQPGCGVVVCLVKNVIKGLLFSGTGGVGEMCNFLLGICFVIPAGFIYRYKKTRSGALIGALAGAVIMALCSIPVNYFISYPVYTKFLPIDVIISMYQEIVTSFNGLLARAGAPSLPAVNGLLSCLIAFNAPFTLLKGLLNMGLCFLIYKPLSPLLHK